MKKEKSLNAGKQILEKLNGAKKQEVLELKAEQKIKLKEFKEKQAEEVTALRTKQKDDIDEAIQKFFNSYEGSKATLFVEETKAEATKAEKAAKK